jgi:hypothetical protein
VGRWAGRASQLIAVCAKTGANTNHNRHRQHPHNTEQPTSHTKTRTCASSVSLAMRAGVDSSAGRSARTTSTPSRFRDPAATYNRCSSRRPSAQVPCSRSPNRQRARGASLLCSIKKLAMLPPGPLCAHLISHPA